MLGQLFSTAGNLLSTTCNLANTGFTAINCGVNQISEGLLSLTDLTNNPQQQSSQNQGQLNTFNNPTQNYQPNTLSVLITKQIPNNELIDKLAQISEKCGTNLEVSALNNDQLGNILQLGIPVKVYSNTDTGLKQMLNNSQVIAIITDNELLKEKVLTLYKGKIIFK